MIDPRILMIPGLVFGFIYSFKVKSFYARLITWLTVLSAGVMMLEQKEFALDGYYLFIGLQFGILLYAFSNDEFSPLKKTTLTVSAIGTALPALLLLLNLAPASFPLIALFSAVVILAFAIHTFKTEKNSLKEELGFMAVIVSDAAVKIIGAFVYYFF